jgi:cell wall-associated NlpC family hydrolase
MSTVEKVSENQNTILQDYQESQARLADLERSAKVDSAGLKAQDKQLATLRAASAAKVTAARAVLARLTEEERKRLAAEEAAVQAAAQQVVDQAAANAVTNPTLPTTDAGSASASASASGKGAVALAYAKKQLGKPYVWGATGPGSFDCSGLTSSAWRAAGVSIPRTSRAQSTGAGAAVAQSDLRPGDLVFFYSPVSHVGMYVGNGMIIHAPRPGKSVTYTQLSSMPYAGARRPG